MRLCMYMYIVGKLTDFWMTVCACLLAWLVLPYQDGPLILKGPLVGPPFGSNMELPARIARPRGCLGPQSPTPDVSNFVGLYWIYLTQKGLRLRIGQVRYRFPQRWGRTTCLRPSTLACRNR